MKFEEYVDFDLGKSLSNFGSDQEHILDILL